MLRSPPLSPTGIPFVHRAFHADTDLPPPRASTISRGDRSGLPFKLDIDGGYLWDIAFLEEAARHELGWSGADAIDAALARGREALAGIGAFEAAGLIRNDRDTRAVDRG